ncbi:MAG: hypothetical protein L0Y55_15940, partial [Anaerolineales bacterium]|nr:hypothetical protein [Anaerolineales bacterium]
NETANAVWDLANAQYQDVAEAGGKHHIFFTVLDAANKPAPNITCVVDWVGREPGDVPTKVVTDANGQANVAIFANLDITLKNGPYFAFVEDQSKSDFVSGMGLPEKHHVCFLLTFVRRASGGMPVPTTTLEQTVLTEAKKRTWMPINDLAALYKFAQQNNLGYPQTDEYEFTCNNEGYIGQVFNLGIVYVKKGDWGNVKWVKKPS